MSSSGDFLVYNNGIETQLDDEFFSSRKMLFIQDQNSGVYNSGNIQIDGSSLSNASGYLNWSESYLAVPYIATITTSAANLGAARKDFALSLKNGSHQIINSFTAEVGGKSLLNLTPYINEVVSYKLMNEFSNEDVHTLGDTLLFHPDSGRSNSYLSPNTATQRFDVGINNNVSSTFLAEDITPNSTNNVGSTNMGLIKRQLMTSYNATTSGLADIIPKSALDFTAKSHVVLVGNRTMVYKFICIIRLKDLSDLFAKLDMPLKGLYIRFQLQMNQGTQVISRVAAVAPAGGLPGADAKESITSTSTTSNTFPIMYNRSSDCVADNHTVTIKCGVSNVDNHVGSFNSVRLYVASYTMRPESEARYLSSGVVKSITYEDVQVFEIKNTPPSGTINSILTNGISNPTKLVICPHLSASSNAGLDPLLSSYSSEPATVSPIPLSQFNIQLAGESIQNITEQYNFEMFLNERRSSTLNGGLTKGVSSGLIGQREWESAYRYHVFDLHRRNTETKDVPLSVQVQCQNFSSKTCDLRCFIYYQREMKLDITTGQLV